MTVADESVMTALAQFNGHHIRLVGGDLMANGFNRSRSDVGSPQQAKVVVDINDG